MSTIMYLRCVTHDPYIESDEVGHHKGHLPEIRAMIRGRDLIVKNMETAIDRDEVVENIPELRQRNAWWFLHAHPRCDLEIWDEYGREYSMGDTVGEKPITAETPLGKVKMVVENEEGVIIHFGELTPEGKRVVNRMMQT
jgi:hypothetical protein